MTIHRLIARACVRPALAVHRRPLTTKTPPFPTTPTCPAPTCPCAPAPELPEGFEIDRKAPLNGLIPSYAQHVLVCTGKDDWTSRIEDDDGRDNLVRELRNLIGPKGQLADPFYHISPLACSFPSTPIPRAAQGPSQDVIETLEEDLERTSEKALEEDLEQDLERTPEKAPEEDLEQDLEQDPERTPEKALEEEDLEQTPEQPPPEEPKINSVYLLPQFKYIPYLPRDAPDSVEALVRGYLQPEKLHPMYENLSPQHRDKLVRDPKYRELLWGVRDVAEVVVLICGHGGRDQRCGMYGPLLRDAFEERLPERGVEVLRGPVEVEVGEEGEAVDAEVGEEGEAVEVEGEATGRGYTARVGLISHVGGHKFAGNVIVYLPPGLRTEDGQAHPLAGHGIWYGRVEPRHVEGIVGETILNGRVIEELFRGGIKQSGEMLRL